MRADAPTEGAYVSRIANVARATRAIIPISESRRTLPGRRYAATATARPSSAYFTRRETKSLTFTPDETGWGFVSGIFIMKKHYKFRILIDSDVVSTYKIKNKSQIEYEIVSYLTDPDGWISQGYTFEPGDGIIIRLSSPATIHQVCSLPSNLNLSCAELNGKNVYLNADRWFRGASKSKLSLHDYRQYMVSHEIGHILGFTHEKCPCPGCPAPIMMQQTLGIGKCVPNTKWLKGK